MTLFLLWIEILVLHLLQSKKCMGSIGVPEERITTPWSAMNIEIHFPDCVPRLPNMSEDEKEVQVYVSQNPHFNKQHSTGIAIPDFQLVQHTPEKQKTTPKISIHNNFKSLREGLSSFWFDEDVDEVLKEYPQYTNFLKENFKHLSSILDVLDPKQKIFPSEMQKENFHSSPTESGSNQFSTDHQKLPNIKMKDDPKISSEGTDLPEHLRETIIMKSLLQRLNRSLNQIDSIVVKDPEHILNSKITQTSLMLQRVIFQIIDYMYSNDLMKKEDFIGFYKTKGTLEISSFNMIVLNLIKYDNGALFPSYVTSNSIIGSCYTSHFKTLFKELEDDERRYLSYLNYKLFYDIQIKRQLNQGYDDERKVLANQIFQYDNLFQKLEQYNLKKGELHLKGQGTEYNDQNYEKIKHILNHLKIYIMQYTNVIYECTRMVFSFLTFLFVEENYGEIVLEIVQEDLLFKAKLALMKSSLKFIDEIGKIEHYLYYIVRNPYVEEKGRSHYIYREQKSKEEAIQELYLIAKYTHIISYKHAESIRESSRSDNYGMNALCFLGLINKILSESKTQRKRVMNLIEIAYGSSAL
ncbi:hypothetical protein PGT21_020979 [Puccinia graminis f. sp. tritici]|uniref:Uncharacterized protein n=1 Tax=Puccinia graminis f. sp. tritici TaxID=56615 RepID=A0A5B0P9R1_PUCGR|nr:hypothetical protein PGT21_020979 [Puccinia graminis f. sp. tritici]